MAASPATAAPLVCELERQPIVNHLSKKYGESRVGTGIASYNQTNSVFEIFINPTTGSWTIIATLIIRDETGASTTVKTCLIVAGEDWQSYLPITGQEAENEQL